MAADRDIRAWWNAQAPPDEQIGSRGPLRPDVTAAYESFTGYAPRDMEFYTLYAALRHAIVMSRVARRSILFGEMEMPADPDDLIMHRATLEQMLDGTYWSNQ